jgi:hypothetical protein
MVFGWYVDRTFGSVKSASAAAVPVGKVVQTAQTNSNEAAQKVYEEAEKLYQQGTAEA